MLSCGCEPFTLCCTTIAVPHSPWLLVLYIVCLTLNNRQNDRDRCQSAEPQRELILK